MERSKILRSLLIIGAIYYFIGAVVHFFGFSLFPWYDGRLYSPYHDTVIALVALIFGLLLIIIARDLEKYRSLIDFIIIAGLIAIIFSLYIIFNIDLVGTTKRLQTIVEAILLGGYIGLLSYLKKK